MKAVAFQLTYHLMTKQGHRTSKSDRSKLFIGVSLLLAAVLACFLYLRFRGDHPPIPGPSSVDEASEVQAADTGLPDAGAISGEDSMQARVLGRWLREDGGYILEIREVAPDGRLSAAYFNPNPIHVSNAAVVQDGGMLKVGIELNDVNYPGCLYTLVLDPQLDQLVGTYFQAALGQTFQVAFVRVPVE